MKRLWYLSGGMTKFGAEDYDESNIWRIRFVKKINQLADEMDITDIKVFNPNEHFSLLSDPTEFTNREAMNIDIEKLRKSELVIYCNNDPFSRGSMIEIGIAYERRIPILVFNPDLYEIHPWVRDIAQKVFDDENCLFDYLKDHYARID